MARVYESRTNRALVHNYFIARKYCVLSRYVATFFNDAYQTISDIQFIATGRVAPVTGYNWAGEASPTLGCSIEISRGMSVGMYVCRMSNHVESRESNTRMLKVSIGR